MGSLGVESIGKKKSSKAMWMYPKIVGFNPRERWGHSACYVDGILYVFGGCCGGSHFGDVVALDVKAMTWAPVETTGEPPGTRDSHTVALVGYRMVVFGGTDNGSRKVSDVHVLDLRTREWRRVRCSGEAPCARESHSATVVGGEKVVVFGGSGGGRYLDDVHVLDVGRMEWTRAETRGETPTARDSHTAVAVGKKVVVYGGDSGDRYHGEVDLLDVDTMTWSTLTMQCHSPDVRAGHAAVSIGTKVYVIGGVGDKHYYSDVWVLDLNRCSWNQLDPLGRRPRGRFSHTAVVANNDIIIYGGCGEDERPLDELLLLRLGSEQHPNNGVFGNDWSRISMHKFVQGSEIVGHTKRGPVSGKQDDEGLLSNKRMRVGDRKTIIGNEFESAQFEEHSTSLSQTSSSPSHSDRSAIKMTRSLRESTLSSPRHSEYGNQLDHRLGSNQSDRRVPNGRFPFRVHTAEDQRFQSRSALIGAQVLGTVDGAFDSGYLLTANVNGQIFRGVLFSPGPSAIIPRPVQQSRTPSFRSVAASQPHGIGGRATIPLHPSVGYDLPGSGGRAACEPKGDEANQLQDSKLSGDLEGVFLTLGGPG